MYKYWLVLVQEERVFQHNALTAAIIHSLEHSIRTIPHSFPTQDQTDTNQPNLTIMHFQALAVLASTLAITQALPAGKTPPLPTSNIEYCESRGTINALNCIKLLNNLNLDVSILGKREAGRESTQQGGSASPAPEQTVEICKSSGFLNLANCLDILNGLNVDLDILKRDAAPGWTDVKASHPGSGYQTPDEEAEEPEYESEEPEKGEGSTGSGSSSGSVDVDDCESEGLLNVLNCDDILNDVTAKVGILDKE